MNGLIEGSELADASSVDIVKRGTGGVFDNGARAWDHAFSWNCMSASGGGDPQAELAAAIERDFGSSDNLVDYRNDKIEVS